MQAHARAYYDFFTESLMRYINVASKFACFFSVTLKIVAGKSFFQQFALVSDGMKKYNSTSHYESQCCMVLNTRPTKQEQRKYHN